MTMKSKFLKKSSVKLLATIMASCSLLGFCGLGNFSAQAKTEYPISVANYDGVDYSGVRIDKNNVDTFRESVDLSSCDLDTPIFQFVITPSQRGDGQKYTPDFEKLTFTLSDSSNKAMSVSFSPRYADNPQYKYICAFAGGENQTQLGEHQNNLKYEIDKDNPECVLSDTYASISPYTFDGYGASYSDDNRPFFDKNGNKAEEGTNGVIGIYYDREENALYADSGWRWVDDDEDKPHTLVDKYKIAPNGERRWRIRDFDKTDYKKGGNTVSSLWSGFENLSSVTLKVDFAQKKNNDYSILLVSLGGEMLTGNYYVEYKNKGLVGKFVNIPKPMYFSKTIAYNYESLEDAEYLVKDPDGNVVVEKTAYATGVQFLPNKAGIYTVEYFAKDPNEQTIKTHPLKITVLQTGGSNLQINGTSRNYLVYDEIDAGYSLENNIQEDLPDVYVTIKKDGSVIVPRSVCAPDYKYYFDSEGVYQFDYDVTDYLGQTVNKSFTCVVNNFALKLNSGVQPTVLYSSMSNFELPTANDYSLIKVTAGTKVDPTKVDIKVRLNGGEWANLTVSAFSGEGLYDILYEYHYNGVKINAQRQIAIYNELPTISIEKVPANTVIVAGESLANDSVRVKALTGKQIVFSYGYFKSSTPVKVEKISGSTVEDVTANFSSGSYIVTFSEEGEYCISAVIEIGDVYAIRKNVFISVKSSWIEIETPSEKTFDVGKEISIEVPKAKDFYGNELTGGTFSVTIGGQEVAVSNGKFTPKAIGVYNIVYTVSDQTGSNSCEFVYYVIDKVAPTITTTGEVKTSSKGKKVSLASVKVLDNAELDTGYTVSVTYNGKVVSVFNNKFLAENEGTYLVTITAIDASGNTSRYSYEITIGPKNNTGIVLAIIGGVVVVLAGCASVLLIVIKSKKSHKKKEEEKESEQNEEKID